MANFPSAVSTEAQLGIAANGAQNQLNGAINNSVTTITVDDTTSFSTAGYIVIDTEIIKYTGKTATTFTGCTRGSDGSAAVSHTDNTAVYGYVVAAHTNNLKDEVVAIEQNISDRFGLHASNAFSSKTNILSVHDFGAQVTIGVQNTTNTSIVGHARLYAEVGGASGGDPKWSLSVVGGPIISGGIDNSDSDKFKMGWSDTVGASSFMVVTTDGAVSIQGTATNDNAAAGFVGEIISSTVAGQAIGPSGQYSDITSLALTAGDWDVTAFLELDANGATSIASTLIGISTTSGNSSAGLTPGVNRAYYALPSPGSIPRYRISIAANTTYYFKHFATYATATPLASATISARRVR